MNWFAQESPDGSIVETAPNEEQNPGQEEVQKESEKVVESESTEKVEEVQNSDTAKDDSSENEDTGSDKWIGRRLERVKQKEQAKAKADAAAEIEYWKRQAMSGNTQSTQPVQPAGSAKPKLGDYNDIEKYTEDVTNWGIKNALQQAEFQAKSQKVVTDYQTRAAEYAEKISDFTEVVNQFAEDYGDVNIPELQTFAMKSKNGPELVYHLAKHPEDMERIIDLPSEERSYELGKLRDKLAAPKVVKKSNAPAPISTEKGAASLSKDLSDPKLSQAEYRKLRMQSRPGIK